MLACSLRVFLANEVLDLICTEDSIDENECFTGLLDESDDEFEAMCDYTDSVTGETLISDDFLSPSSASLVLHANGNPDPAEMDSLLNNNSDCIDSKPSMIVDTV